MVPVGLQVVHIFVEQMHPVFVILVQEYGLIIVLRLPGNIVSLTTILMIRAAASSSAILPFLFLFHLYFIFFFKDIIIQLLHVFKSMCC